MIGDQNKGLIRMPTWPQGDDSESQPEQNVELALKKKREKLAQDKLGIAPEVDTSV